jgi:hypothetical protein
MLIMKRWNAGEPIVRANGSSGSRPAKRNIAGLGGSTIDDAMQAKYLQNVFHNPSVLGDGGRIWEQGIEIGIDPSTADKLQRRLRCNGIHIELKP